MPADLKALGVSLSRRIRHDTPDADVMTRMAQSLALMVWLKAHADGEGLLTLNRALGELTRTMRLLGFKLPGAGGSGRLGRRQQKGLIIAPRPRAVEVDEDGGDDAA